MTTRRKPAPPPAEGLMDLLGGHEVPTAPVEPPDPLWGAIDVTWPKVPAGRHLCQDCVELIHGRPDGPHPRAAVRRRKGPVDDRLLCHEHAIIRQDADEKAKRVHADRIAAAKAARKAAIAAAGQRRTRHREHA